MASGMMFCPDCDNLLQPKEDFERRELKFLCRRCDFFKYSSGSPAENCVDRINVGNKTKQDFRVPPDLARDPTLGRVRDWFCVKCERQVEAVYFELPERLAEDAMTLVFVCAACGHWKKQERAEEDGDADDAGDEFSPELVKRDMLFKTAPDEDDEINPLLAAGKQEPEDSDFGDDEPFQGKASFPLCRRVLLSRALRCLREESRLSRVRAIFAETREPLPEVKPDADLFGDALPDTEGDWEEVAAEGDALHSAAQEGEDGEDGEESIFGSDSPQALLHN